VRDIEGSPKFLVGLQLCASTMCRLYREFSYPNSDCTIRAGGAAEGRPRITGEQASIAISADHRCDLGFPGRLHRRGTPWVALRSP
jgi:hypothetical protein